MKQSQTNRFQLANLFIGLAAFVMIFLPALIFKESETSFTGLEISFGKQFSSLGSLASGEVAFNPIVLLAFGLTLVGALIPLFIPQGYIVSTIAFIAAAILLFLMPEFTTVTVTILGNANEVDVEWTYGIGLILAASFSIIGALLGVFKLAKHD